MKVLLIDDDAGVIKAIGRVLISGGYEVITAMDGMRGTAMTMNERPDLIIMDLKMPAGDGHQVGRRLKDNLDTCSIPIIILSGSMKAEDIRRAKEWGASRVLLKPPNVAELMKAVAEVSGSGGTNP